MHKQKNQAFTLVELIVVITILAILGTISFISLQGYSQSARDSVRISDLSNISKGLELQLTKGGKVSMPDDKVDITASGTVISYQGYAGKQVLQNIGVNGGGKDPVDDNYYTYATSTNLLKYQIMGFLENGDEISLLNNTFSADYLTRFPIVKGDQLGILLSSGSLVPVQEIGVGVDIINTNNDYRAYLNNESMDLIVGTGASLQIGLSHRINEKGSCNDLLKNGRSKGDGVYSINPTGTGSFEVYCDMTNNGGGWTLLMKGTRGQTFKYSSNYWTMSNVLNDTDLSLTDADAKYAVFNTLKINDIMARWPDAGGIFWFKKNAWNQSTALQGFDTYNNWGIPQEQFDWNPTYFSAQTKQCDTGPGRYGTKLASIGSSNYGARWGYRFNENACGDFNSDDAGGGIGIRTTRDSNWEYSGGDWSNCCRSTTGMLRSARFEIYGR